MIKNSGQKWTQALTSRKHFAQKTSGCGTGDITSP